jgi:hypothetical protein
VKAVNVKGQRDEGLSGTVAGSPSQARLSTAMGQAHERGGRKSSDKSKKSKEK